MRWQAPCAWWLHTWESSQIMLSSGLESSTCKFVSLGRRNCLGTHREHLQKISSHGDIIQGERTLCALTLHCVYSGFWHWLQALSQLLHAVHNPVHFRTCDALLNQHVLIMPHSHCSAAAEPLRKALYRLSWPSMCCPCLMPHFQCTAAYPSSNDACPKNYDV